MKYKITFPMTYKWRPKSLIGIQIDDIKVVYPRCHTKNGFVFDSCEGIIDGEDATVLRLKGENFKFRKISDK